MPTETFLNLSQDKKDKIIMAAKREFARTSFNETSIQNIIKEAQIARGSFYQYFESKEDLLSYILSDYINHINHIMQKYLIETKGDIFDLFLKVYDHTINHFMKKEDKELGFYKNVFSHFNMNMDSMLPIIKKEISKILVEDYLEKINTESLILENPQDLKIITKMLSTITRNAIAEVASEKISITQARKQFEKELYYLKNGMVKKET